MFPIIGSVRNEHGCVSFVVWGNGQTRRLPR
ncbi:hypothetical protein F0726_02828 [Acidithiobacillus caldus]|nr:hypothetical protein F0726_02828 [Acidithiobacillus caldus]